MPGESQSGLADREVSWDNAEALQLQDPQVLFDCSKACSLQQHPDFAWPQPHIDKETAHEKALILAAKSHQDPQFKFGVQLPKNSKHANALDALHGNTNWKESTDKELKSLKDFKTFGALDKGRKHLKATSKFSITWCMTSSLTAATKVA